MENIKYANAYKEVLSVINNLIKEDYEKIPKEYIEFLKTNANQDYEFEYDTSKTFAEQELLDDTKYILFGLFEKFDATDEQKAKINSFKMNYINKLEEQKREKYNPDNVFKNHSPQQEEKTITNEVSMIEYKESLFKRIINKIKNIFHIN